MIELNKWDHRFFGEAAEKSSWSKDRTKVGACLVRPDKTIASSGFNGLPPGMDDDLYLRDRDFKNLIVLHAEENAIHKCKDPYMDGYTMYVWGLTPCGHCASVMSTKGIKKVYAVSSQVSNDWNASCDAAKIVFVATGVEFYDCTYKYFFKGLRIQ